MFHLLRGLGWHFISMLSEKNICIYIKAMSPKQSNYCSMGFKHKYNESCTYTLAGTCNKTENFQ